MVVNYALGKIYKIAPIGGSADGDIYVGSTTKKLSQRMACHRSDYKRWKEGKHHRTTSYDIFEKYGVENCVITLLEQVNATCKDDLNAKERHYIESLVCVNKCIVGRTPTEYREENREIVLKRKAVYREANREQLSTKQQEYAKANMEKILKQRAEFREANREHLKEQQLRYYQNRKLKKTTIGRHIEYIKSMNNINEYHHQAQPRSQTDDTIF
jgi:hypothetical protein